MVNKQTKQKKVIFNIKLTADIGANLTDPMFRGIYGGSTKHQADLDKVLERAWQHGLQKLIITSGCVGDVDEALQLTGKDGK